MLLSYFWKLAGDMTPRQAFSSGVIICPEFGGTAVWVNSFTLKLRPLITRARNEVKSGAIVLGGILLRQDALTEANWHPRLEQREMSGNRRAEGKKHSNTTNRLLI